MGYTFCILSKKSLPSQSSWRYLSVLFYKPFLCSTFVFHLELFSIFMEVKSQVSFEFHRAIQRREERNSCQNPKPTHREGVERRRSWICSSLFLWFLVGPSSGWDQRWWTSGQPLRAENRWWVDKNGETRDIWHIRTIVFNESQSSNIPLSGSDCPNKTEQWVIRQRITCSNTEH